ncbi:MAG: glycosyltransferase family 4 protein [Verrucomicrobia bacterium]|nr:glycosyltransferase family 4 protein [Verrucomicrobiota bacterium]
MKRPRRLAIIHFHLRPGGVTRVIGHALAALGRSGARVAVLAGPSEHRDIPADACVREVEGLGYAEDLAGSAAAAEGLADRLKETARSALGGPPDLWHFHNHSLGKSGAVPLAIKRLAAEGQRLLLQIHDFPEDGRPANYRSLLEHVGESRAALLGRRLYPQAAHIHYATLNTRDLAFLRAAGVAADRLHFLPNPVAMRDSGEEPAAAGAKEKPGLYLYPTRAIRRKNIGEFLLWAALGRKNDRFAITLAPTSPTDRTVYERWMAFARELRLPVEFEIGRDGTVPFSRLLARASAVVTTSVAEGFGLAFLEPWLAGRPLLCRDLPELTGEFKSDGLDLSALYARLLVPLDWVGPDELRRRIAGTWPALLAAYGRAPKRGDTEKAFSAACEGTRVDFGRLDEALQEKVIRRATSGKKAAARFSPARLVPDRRLDDMVKKNHELTRQLFNLQQYGQRLAEIYSHVLESEPGPADPMNPDKLLDLFLAPDRFFLLRT